MTSDGLAPLPSSAPPPWVGEARLGRLGRFAIGPELGQGGMGRVHQAWDPMLRRVVAVKILIKDDPLLLMQFLQEAQTQARVDHPNVCRVYEVGTDGDTSFIVMQCINGQTLGQMRHELPILELVRIMADVSAGVHAAHRQGLVHRDIKPGNVLLEKQEDGYHKPYVVDFGLARDLSSMDPGLSWGMVGTPAYMSPEQARGNLVGPLADVYSLGATMFTALCGLPPHDASTLPALIQQHATRPARALRGQNPDVGRDLDVIVGKCLEVDPHRRYASAFALEEDLRRWLAGEPIHARPLAWHQRFRHRVFQHRTLSAVILASLVVSGGLLGWSVQTRRQVALREHLTQRLLAEIQAGENSLRLERMLPQHNIRPSMERLRERIPIIQRLMAETGRVSEGPGHYTLGRVHLGLGQLARAQDHLERAWEAGFHGTLVRQAMVEVLSLQCFAELDRALALKDLEHQARVIDEIRQRRGGEIRRYQKGIDEDSGGALSRAYLALVKGEYHQAVAACRESLVVAPWHYEAMLLEAQAYKFLAASLVKSGGWTSEVSDLVARWSGGLEAASAIAHSDERVHAALAQHHLWVGTHQAPGSPAREAALTRSAEHGALARQIQPGCLDTVAVQARLVRFRGLDALPQGRDLCRELRDLLQPLLQADIEHGEKLQVGEDEVWLAWALGTALQQTGGDPRPWTQWALGHLLQEESSLKARLLLLQAAIHAESGQDPQPLFDEARALLEVPRGVVLGESGSLLAELLEAQARWRRATGREDLEVRELGLRQARGLLVREPQDAGGRLALSGLLLMRAQEEAVHGRTPLPDLLEAERILAPLESARERFQDAVCRRADLQFLRAAWALRTGADALGPLAIARTALGRLPEGSIPVLNRQAELELWAARAQWGKPAFAVHLEAARQHLQAGLTLAAADPGLNLLRLRLSLLRRRAGLGPDPQESHALDRVAEVAPLLTEKRWLERRLAGPPGATGDLDLKVPALARIYVLLDLSQPPFPRQDP